MAIADMDTARLRRFGFPSIGHHPDWMVARLQDLGRGAECEPGILLQDQTLNRKGWLVVRRDGHSTSLARCRSNQVQMTSIPAHGNPEGAQHVLDQAVLDTAFTEPILDLLSLGWR